jgi:L-malate glycosyltransferase
MRIGFFTQNVSKGGLDTFIINLLDNWPIEDEIVLFCNRSHPGLDYLRNAVNRNVEFIDYSFLIAQDLAIICSKLPRFLGFFAKLFFWLLGFQYMLWRIRHLLRQYPLDRLMIINGGYPGGDACLAATVAWATVAKGRPLAWHNFHNLVLPYSNTLLRKLKELLIDFILVRCAKGFCTVSQSSLDSMAVRPLLSFGPKLYIYNGIQSIAPGKSASLRGELGLTESSRIILMLGTYEPRKGHAFLFEAMSGVMSQDAQTYLLVCGYGSQEEIESVNQLLRSNPLRSKIFLEGYRQITSGFLVQADILVIPSQEQESFGYTAVEAMSCRLPVICTDVGGLPEVVLNGVTGYVVERDNPVEFGSAISSLLADRKTRLDMGEAGRQRVQRLFAAKRMAEQYARLIQQ